MAAKQQPGEPAGDIVLCPICDENLEDSYDNEFAHNYPGLVCHSCADNAVNSDGGPPHHSSMGDFGDNPVFIDSRQCWRRYKFGGYVTMLDPDNCESESQFYIRHFGRSRSPLEQMVEQANRAILEGDGLQELE